MGLWFGPGDVLEIFEFSPQGKRSRDCLEPMGMKHTPPSLCNFEFSWVGCRHSAVQSRRGTLDRLWGVRCSTIGLLFWFYFVELMFSFQTCISTYYAFLTSLHYFWRFLLGEWRRAVQDEWNYFWEGGIEPFVWSPLHSELSPGRQWFADTAKVLSHGHGVLQRPDDAQPPRLLPQPRSVLLATNEAILVSSPLQSPWGLHCQIGKSLSSYAIRSLCPGRTVTSPRYR